MEGERSGVLVVEKITGKGICLESSERAFDTVKVVKRNRPTYTKQMK